MASAFWLFNSLSHGFAPGSMTVHFYMAPGCYECYHVQGKVYVGLPILTKFSLVYANEIPVGYHYNM